VLIYRCEVCGSIDDLRRMTSRLTARTQTAAERQEYLPDAPSRR